jgi:hypothetical protein
MKIATSRTDLAKIGLSSALPGVLALIGLHPSLATFGAGGVVLIAGVALLVPAQSSRFVSKALEVAGRCCSPAKPDLDESQLP